MAKQEFSTRTLADLIQTEADAYLLLERLRWNGAPSACPKCGEVGKTYFMEPRDGSDTRKTRTGSRSARRVWKCRGCRQQFSVLTDTIFHGTKISIRTWLFVIFEFCAAKNSVSAWEISRKYSITNESAWHMLHRIREAMKREPLADLMSGIVASDETWIGGKPSNQSKAKRAPRRGWNGAVAGGHGKTEKPSVLALVDTTTGEVRSQVVADVKGDTLRSVLSEQVEMGATTLVTDEWSGYKVLSAEVKGHETVNHKRDEYVNERGYTTNNLERYFGQLKRSIDGTHHAVSKEHLPRYLAQFDFLATYHRDTDSERMRRVIGNVEGRRLTYKPLAGE
jgi:transposase-like protein